MIGVRIPRMRTTSRACHATLRGDWDGSVLDQAGFLHLLHQRIDALDVDQARADVRPFHRDASPLDIWSSRYFRDLSDRVVCV